MKIACESLIFTCDNALRMCVFIFVLIFSRTKKRVVFADDKGKSLTEVRVMSEPSNVPPLWSIEFLSHVTQGLITPDVTDEWSISFKQPASDYLNFRWETLQLLPSIAWEPPKILTFLLLISFGNRQKLDSKNVSLENVIIKEAESMVVGTVKVKNLGFQKEVFVRSTWDNWKTQQDTICTYTPVSGEVSNITVFSLSQIFLLFCFFSFDLKILSENNKWS